VSLLKTLGKIELKGDQVPSLHLRTGGAK